MQVTDAQDLVTYDVVVVGGGAAGLGGALMLGRSRRSVLVVDAGEPRNAPASGVHGFLTRDGMDPAALLEVGRDEVRGYGARVLDGRVASAEPVDGGFTVDAGGRPPGRRKAAARYHGAGRRVAGRSGGPGALGARRAALPVLPRVGGPGPGRSASWPRVPWPCIRRYCSGS